VFLLFYYEAHQVIASVSVHFWIVLSLTVWDKVHSIHFLNLRFKEAMDFSDILAMLADPSVFHSFEASTALLEL